MLFKDFLKVIVEVVLVYKNDILIKCKSFVLNKILVLYLSNIVYIYIEFLYVIVFLKYI